MVWPVRQVRHTFQYKSITHNAGLNKTDYKLYCRGDILMHHFSCIRLMFVQRQRVQRELWALLFLLWKNLNSTL